MSASRPARALLPLARWSAAARAARATTLPLQSQSQSLRLYSSKKPRYRNISAEEMGLVSDPKKMKAYVNEKFPEYTAEEKEALRKKYTPAQMAAIEAGEESIDPEDLAIQGRLRDDRYQLNYIDDFAKVQPIIDLKPETTTRPDDPKGLFVGEQEFEDQYWQDMSRDVGKTIERTVATSVARAFRKVKEEAGDDLAVTEEELHALEHDPVERRRLLSQQPAQRELPPPPPPGSAEGEDNPDMLTQERAEELSALIDREFIADLKSSLADGKANPLEETKLEMWENYELEPNIRDMAWEPSPRKIPGLEHLYNVPADKEAEDENYVDSEQREYWERLSYHLNIPIEKLRSLLLKELDVRYVSNQTRLGKIQKSRIVMMAGNGSGWIGVGIAKAPDTQTARIIASMLAIKDMRPIRRYENRTIFGKVTKKVGAVVVELDNLPPGYGLRCPSLMFELCRAVGIHDIRGRVLRGRTRMNVVKAVVEALRDQADPEAMAIGRGRKMVDARKVYYGGNV